MRQLILGFLVFFATLYLASVLVQTRIVSLAMMRDAFVGAGLALIFYIMSVIGGARKAKTSHTDNWILPPSWTKILRNVVGLNGWSRAHKQALFASTMVGVLVGVTFGWAFGEPIGNLQDWLFYTGCCDYNFNYLQFPDATPWALIGGSVGASVVVIVRLLSSGNARPSQ